MKSYTDTDRMNDFDYFIRNYQDLYQRFGHKFIVIKDKSVLGAYDREYDAINDIKKIYPLGTFIVQECNGDESGYTNYISSWGIRDNIMC